MKIDSDLKTLNPNNFYDPFSLELNLPRNLFNRRNSISDVSEDICNHTLKRNFEKKTKFDFGVYKTIDKVGVCFSFGGKLITKCSSQKKI